MKKKSLIVSLLLTAALVLGSFASVFAAAGAPTEATKKAVADAKVQTVQKIKDEVTAENFCINFANEVQEGGYKLIDTAGVAAEIGKDTLIIDTMPQGWWNQRHIPGAVCSIVGANNGPAFEILPEEKTALLKLAKDATGSKVVKKYWNAKSKKWVSKKPAKKYWKKCTKKKDADYGKKTKKVYKNFDKKIIVYCGFVGCARSHQGAMTLVDAGYTNVYRYAGGISAWVDANQNIEGSDIG